MGGIVLSGFWSSDFLTQVPSYSLPIYFTMQNSNEMCIRDRPCVSDPGEVIVRDALARGIKVVPVPAASACVTALAVSGQDTSCLLYTS